MTAWTEGKPFGVLQPGQKDSVIVLLADGKCVEVTTVDSFGEVVRRGQRLAIQTNLALKVLPMTMREYVGFARIKAEDFAKTPQLEAELRKDVVDMLRLAMVEAPDLATRLEARELLHSMGEAAC